MPSMSRRSFLLSSLGVASACLAGCGAGESGLAASSSAASTSSSCVTSATGAYASGTHHATIEVEDY